MAIRILRQKEKPNGRAEAERELDWLREIKRTFGWAWA